MTMPFQDWEWDGTRQIGRLFALRTHLVSPPPCPTGTWHQGWGEDAAAGRATTHGHGHTDRGDLTLPITRPQPKKLL
jgi:hypothetical protein